MLERAGKWGLLLALGAMGLTAGCKKKTETTPTQVTTTQPVEVSLQVTSVSPASVPPDQAASATVYGSAFTSGAQVTLVGATEANATSVSVSSSNALSVGLPALPVGSYDVRVTLPDGSSSTLRAGLAVRQADAACRNATVYFDFDRSNIRADARSILDGHMSCYQSLTGQIRIEGHTDERGTVDYNLALGQRRSDAAKKYLVRNGVSSTRVTATSYGEERPADRSQSESGWANNRRAEITASE